MREACRATEQKPCRTREFLRGLGLQDELQMTQLLHDPRHLVRERIRVSRKVEPALLSSSSSVVVVVVVVVVVAAVAVAVAALIAIRRQPLAFAERPLHQFRDSKFVLGLSGQQLVSS